MTLGWGTFLDKNIFFYGLAEFPSPTLIFLILALPIIPIEKN